MAVLVGLAEVQTWLEGTKLTLSALDANLVDTQQVEVLSALQGTFDISGWTNVDTTPALVRKILAMYIAGWTYVRQYSEATATSKNVYASWLIQKADQLLAGVLMGTLTLAELPGIDTSQPAFWPNDTTGSTQQYDSRGFPIGDQYSEQQKFTMGKVF